MESIFVSCLRKTFVVLQTLLTRPHFLKNLELSLISVIHMTCLSRSISNYLRLHEALKSSLFWIQFRVDLFFFWTTSFLLLLTP